MYTVEIDLTKRMGGAQTTIFRNEQENVLHTSYKKLLYTLKEAMLHNVPSDETI